MFIGHRLKKCRELRGYSQSYVAEKLGINQGSYSKLEGSKDISFLKLQKITEILGLTIEDVVCFNDKMVFNITNNEKANGLVINQASATEKKLYDQYIETLKAEITHLKSVIEKLLKK